ncbi:MAG: AAA family ATPase [Anaerolineae bacterium]|nr:AAA family ATPase [Anaerolineae bacterium]
MPDISFAPRALALVGMPGAGKSLCAQHLEQQGFFQFRFGSIVTNEVQRRGLALTPQHEQNVREAFRAQDGMAAIALRALPILRTELARRRSIVIDGLYSFSEYELLQAEFRSSMIVVAIVADRALRYERLTARAERPLTPEEALVRDFAEITNLEKGGPIAIADYTLLNNTSPNDLLANLDSLIERLGLEP